MKQLRYSTLDEQTNHGYLLREGEEKVLQFGEGGFLRAFVDYFFDLANEQHAFQGKVALVQPIANGLTEIINAQQGLYTLYLRGFQDGKKVNDKRIISCISRCINPYADYASFLQCAQNPSLRYIVSNTTEAGIVFDEKSLFDQTPPASFPAKLTRFLYERFLCYGKETGKGFIILSCELIDDNGKALKHCVERYIDLWQLGDAFKAWVERENLFCSSLVDRIVTGYPRAEAEDLNRENNYIDSLIDTGEVFGAWVIEGPDWLAEELPFCDGKLPVLVTNDHKPYKQRKVRILNGAHTTMVLGAYLAGQTIVRGCMQDDVIRGYMNKAIYEEIIPTLDLPKGELTAFAASVEERFANPYIDHQLLSIALNSVSKWKARCLPSLKEFFLRFGSVPPCLALGLAFLIAFYHGTHMEKDALMGTRPDGTVYAIKDDAAVLSFFLAHKEDDTAPLCHAVLSCVDFWGEDLTKLPGLESTVVQALSMINEQGAYQAMQAVLKGESL